MKRSQSKNAAASERRTFILLGITLLAQFTLVVALVRELSVAHDQSTRVLRFHVVSLDHTAAILRELSDLEPVSVQPIRVMTGVDSRASVVAIGRHVAGLAENHEHLDDARLGTKLSRLREDAAALALLQSPAGSFNEDGVAVFRVVEEMRSSVEALAAYHRIEANEEILRIQASRGENISAIATLGLLVFSLLASMSVRAVRGANERRRELDRTGRELRQNEDRMRLLLDRSFGLICEVDIDGKIVFVNSRLAELRGLEPSKMAGKIAMGGAHPGDLEALLAKAKSAIETNTPTEIVSRLRDRNGGWLWIQSILIPYQTTEGKTHLVGFGRDLTASRASSEARDRLLKIIDQSGDLIMISDLGGRLSYLNEMGRELLGLAPNVDVTQIKLTDLPYNDGGAGGQQLEDVISTCLASKRWEIELDFRNHTTGEAIPTHCVGFVVYDDYTGDPDSIVTVVRDLTEVRRSEFDRAQLQEEACRSERLACLGILAGGVAHDVNNLLTGILLNTRIAVDAVEPDSTIGWSLARVDEAARQISDLSNQLLAYTATETLNTESVDVTKLVRQTIQSISEATAVGAQLVFDLDPRVLANVNPTQFQQLVMNLVLNASDSLLGDEGEIRVSLKFVADASDSSPWCENLPRAEGVLLEIADTGCGMTERTRQRIFDPFYSTKKTGRGLGLAAALGIVRSHAGEIRVRSQIGEGTKIAVFLPGPMPETPTAETESFLRSASTDDRKKRILIVDDEAVPRESLKLLLRQRGHLVVDAANGSDAVERIEERHGDVDVALIDLSMPDMSGVELFEKLRKQYPEIRGILCSGYPRSHAMRRFGEVGFDAFIQKPYEIERLFSVLEDETTESAWAT